MRTIIVFFWFCFLLYFITSCAPAYTPNIVNTPLLSSKGEFQAIVGTGTSGIDPQLAFAITDHIGIMVNGSFANRADSLNFHKHSFAEIGGGYTISIGDAGRFEIYGGGGMGSIDAMYKEGIFYGRSKATYNRFFIQPSIGAVTDVFEGAFTPRLVFVNMNHSTDSLSYYSTDPFIEPTISAKIGWKYIKVMFQVGFSFPLTKIVNYGHQPFMFSIGLIGKIPGKLHGKSAKNERLNE